ncbi:phosphotransferase [Phenylobacterium sp. LjRoot219]|uniref:phosphotransferase n=1 Tax=Phenylobacterium sp. LjRoot219 TaxID=3342283 RepID=UPI003ECDBDF3
MTVRLIMSGALVGQELAAEFGPLPPAFLPVGVQRLYELQLKALAGAGPVHLVLPETFAAPPADLTRLAELGVEIIPAPEGLSLGEAVVYALNTIGAGDVAVHLLHGDTLIAEPPLHDHDVIVAGPRSTEYAWAEMAIDADGRVRSLVNTPAGEEGHEGWPIAAGYFAFASALDLLRALTRERGDFIAGLNHYLAGRAVQAVDAADWLDFGHLTTFFQSRLAVTTARAFNTVRIDGLSARKSSEDAAKIRAEAHWLQAAPPRVQLYCARLVGFGLEQGQAYYETEYEFLPVLSELFVYGAVGRKPWLRILASCEELLRALAATRGGGCGDAALRALAVDKTLARLEAYARAGGVRIDAPLSYAGRPCPSLLEIAERLVPAMDLASGRTACAMHGDLGFSNLLYDSRNRRIKALDPRGAIEQQPSVYGDLRYDLAKLGHSIVGRYDQIVAGRCRLTRDGGDYDLAFEPVACQPWLAAALGDLAVDGVSGLSEPVRAVTVSLFLSMLPLHADRPDRQQAFVANALRLWTELDR